jgi:hypothetical protein
VPGLLPPVSRCLSAAGVRLLGLPAPAGEWGLPHGRLARHRLDPNGVVTFRMSESRPGWVPPASRGRRCAHDRPGVGQSPPAALQRPVPAAPLLRPIGGGIRDETSSGVHSRSPVRPSPACGPRMERGPSGRSPGSAPRDYSRRTLGRGRVLRTTRVQRLRRQSRTSLAIPTHLKRPRVAPPYEPAIEAACPHQRFTHQRCRRQHPPGHDYCRGQ